MNQNNYNCFAILNFQKIMIKKCVDSQFMCKIIDIMQKYPELVKWSQDATQLILADIDKVCTIILPEYFRHQNFNSFVRQLNMYDFHKVYKVGRQFSFKNPIFFKGNEQNFYKIQRKKRFNDSNKFQGNFQQDCSNLINKINQLNQITPPMKELMIQLLEYKYSTVLSIKKMKEQMDTLCDQLRQCRTKKVLDIIKILQKQIQSAISELAKDSAKIDQFILRQLNSQKKSSCAFSPFLNEIYFSPLPNQRVLSNSQSGNLFGLGMNIFSQSLICKQQNNVNINQSYSKQNIKSFKSIPIFLQQIKTRKQTFNIQRLYNPFNSQNNMMYLPSYSNHVQIGTQKVVIQQDQAQAHNEKIQFDQCLDYDDVSLSVSFVKDLSQNENDFQDS